MTTIKPTIKHAIPFLPWTDRAALEVNIPANAEKRFRLRAAVEVAVKTHADLAGANLTGATIGAHKIASTIAVIKRIEDAYVFRAFRTDLGAVVVTAGCRGPWTTDEYRAHVAANYPGTTRAAETLAILDFIDARAKAMEGR